LYDEYVKAYNGNYQKRKGPHLRDNFTDHPINIMIDGIPLRIPQDNSEEEVIMMSSVILDSFEGEHFIGATLKQLLDEKGVASTYFKLKDMNILPCRSCGSCGLKTPGKCVIDDDMPKIMKAIATSSLYVMLTPIRFGGYSSQLKKAVDRTMSMGFPFISSEMVICSMPCAMVTNPCFA